MNRLKNKLRDMYPQILFLIETKILAHKTEGIRRKCGFPNGIDVDANGLKRGLFLGWFKSDFA